MAVAGITERDGRLIVALEGEIDLEQAHQTPIQGTNNHQNKRSNVYHSH